MQWSLTYASLTVAPRRSSEILDIARVSMRNNARLEVTGVLYFDDHQFFQVLEGEQAVVEALYERVRADPRHRDVTTLQSGPAQARRFPDWSMKFVDGGWVPGGRLRFEHRALCAATPDALASLTRELVAF